MGTCGVADAVPEVRAANTDWRRSSVVPWHDGQAGVSVPRTSDSNWWSQLLHEYSNNGI